jgi:aminoglycoside phosphotransferase (APT) family kinase protein
MQGDAGAGAAPQAFEPLPETVEVRPAHRFDSTALEKLLVARLGARLTGIQQMRGGQSNPTFVLATDKGEFVLRKQPPGTLLPSAHAVDREYRILSALSETDVPVPRPLFFCDDRDVIGTPFYVMERLRGRVFWYPTLPEAAREERRAIYFGMAEALARLHLVDWKAAGLSDYGKPGSYFTRQIARWTKQWDNSRARENPSIDKLAEWLPKNIPPGDDETAIVHGDFRLDNMMFHASEPYVIGIFDWELSTLGHPLADLAYNCARYHLQPEVSHGLKGLDLKALGVPTEQEYLTAYLERTGRKDSITPFHLAFSFFRHAVIVEGVLARAIAGNASSSDAFKTGSTGIALADRGWEIANS